jgi:tetratricopeptide (TPR) repeat protein
MASALGAIVFFCAEGAALADEGFGTCTPSASALVQEGKDLEGMKRDDRAVRHYSDALTLDRSCGDAYIALGTLRLRGGDAREAERIYTVALTTLPSLPEAYAGRARARRILGNRDGARADLAKYATLRGGFESLKELASSYGEDGLAPAQLATWRLILDLARIARDDAQAKEASRMVRALQIVVGQADPVAFPPRVLGARAALAHIARRGG